MQLTSLALDSNKKWIKMKCCILVHKPKAKLKFIPAGTLLIFRMDLPHQGYRYFQPSYRIYVPLDAIGMYLPIKLKELINFFYILFKLLRSS
jgi:hypothetical protein